MTSRSIRRIAVILTLLVFSTTGYAVTWTLLPAGAGPSGAASQAPARVFAADVGMMLNTIKADKAGDFEMVIGKLKEALGKSENPQRRAQAAGWRVFRSVEPGPNNTVLYVFWMDPPVKDADYTVSRILAEAFPAEVQSLYKTFSDSYAGGQSLANLRLVSALGQ